MPRYAGIYILNAPYHVDRIYDYHIPKNLRCDILCGDFVTVPFGVANQKRMGLVVSLSDTVPKEGVICKPVFDICAEDFRLSEEALGLCRFLKEQTLCTMGDAVRAAVPIALFSRMETVYSPLPLPDGTVLDGTRARAYEYLTEHGEVSAARIGVKLGEDIFASVSELVKKGFVSKDIRIKELSEKLTYSYALAVPRKTVDDILSGNGAQKLRSVKQKQILSLLADEGELSKDEIVERLSVTKAQLDALCERGLTVCKQTHVDRGEQLVFSETEQPPLVLSDEQESAFEKIRELCRSNEPQGVLLHGVTGSGKTSVMLKSIDSVLEDGKSVIVLLPEIALTPQTLRIFCSRYGKRVAVIHSALSAGEKIDTYRRIKRGDADVVIGTRSAVFAPLDNLGLIIIDEEQEHTYKSDMNPKYHARDVARYRAAHHKCVMLLASATPSFESYKKAMDGKYTLIELKNRYGGATLPEAIIEDMRPELQAGNVSPLGNTLCRHLLDTHSAREQSILFINRRGYNNFITCRDCGSTIKCPSCSVSMTYHKGRRKGDADYLACHWCGKRLPTPTLCPECGKEHLSFVGYGTQRVEHDLEALMPDACVLRMDTDTTGEKSSYETMLGTFRDHGADVLLGTQMVTKGHDFPDVTLVGVLLADASLYLDDYRAAERTFAMLTQVIGRAGRASKKGRAIIQTNNPDNECIRLACAQDYPSFYKSEIRLRKLLVFPPFCDIVLFTLSSRDEKELALASKKLSEHIGRLGANEYSDVPLITYGPFEAPVYKVENRFRMRMVIKCSNNKRTRAMLSELLTLFSAGTNTVTLSVDINPTNL